MDDEQRAELHRIREEQQILRGQLDRLDERVQRLSSPAAAAPPPPVVPISPPPLPVKPVQPPLIPATPPPLPAQPARPPESLEVQFGAKWLVRLAIFMLVAALAFLANYLYQTVIPHLGPGAKVGLLYLGTGAVTAFGAWLERRRGTQENPGLLNYARVVLAGGLAGVYYVTYAAHHYGPLRVIASPLLAGTLLLGWTAFMTWLADRRNSETLAAFSILLAYYASATSDVASFTLVANLGLTAAAVFLVLRRRWTAFSFASLAATYGSYAFWRYGGMLDHGAGGSGLWIEGAFLACYWALFTVAAFLDRRQTLGEQGQRATFASLNNGAFFGLVGLLVREQCPGEFWKWALIFGAILLALAELGRRLPRRLDAPSVDSYHFGGISLVTLGLMIYFSGWELSLILAVESATVLAAAGRRQRWPLYAAAGLVAAIATLIALAQTVDSRARDHLVPGTICGAVLLFNAWQCRWFRAGRRQGGERYYSALGLAVWFALLEAQITSEIWRSPILAGAALALTALLFPLRIPAAIAFAQLYLAAAYVHWLESYLITSPPPRWNPASLLAVTVLLGTLWEWTRRRPSRTGGSIPAGVGIPYEAAACFLFIAAAPKYYQGAGQFSAFAMGSAVTLALAWIAREPRQKWWSLTLAACAVGSFLLTAAEGLAADFAYLPGILLLAAEQQFARRVGRARGISSPGWEAIMISFAAVCGWAWVSSRFGYAGRGTFTVSSGWSIYGGALFALGILARERVYRWWGLAALGAALGHIVLFDIWLLGSLERFFSLLVISLVLLAIGFFYNRFPSKIREWL